MKAVSLALVVLLALAGCQTTPDENYLVFFAERSVELDQQSQAIIKAAALYAQRNADKPIVVVGFADPTGSAAANQDISTARAQVVRDALVARGITPARITVQGHGELQPKWTNQEVRRVEIRVGGIPILNRGA